MNLRPRFALPFPLLSLLLAGAAAATSAPTFAPEGNGPQYHARANGTQSEVPAIEAFRLDGAPISVDGILDEAAWDRAQTGWGFQQHEPDRGVPASVLSTFKIAYDDDAFYFAMACWENDMADVSSYLGRRDVIESSDLVSLYVDPYHDRTTGYNFRVNPDGVIADAYMFDNGNRDWDWDAVWEAAVTSDERGWYVEMRIPFAAIRFKPTDDMTWGLQVYRWMHGRGEDTGWVTWDRNLNGFVSRWGELTGLQGIENPRNLEIVPYVVTRHTDPAEPDPTLDRWDGLQNFGADIKYGLTSNLTLNATFQPDFGQVEADPAVLNLSPFETRFSEKRPFFIEGARFFQHPDFNLFYSRRIGTGHPNSRIRGAAKLTGKIGGDLSVAVLGAATDVTEPGRSHNPLSAGSQRAYYGLVRVGQEFAEGNHAVNVLGTAVLRDDDSFAGIDNSRLRRDGYSTGLDFQMNFDDRTYQVKGAWVGTRVEPADPAFSPDGTGDAITGSGGDFEIRKNAGTWRGDIGTHWKTDRLDPNDMGFLGAPDEIVGHGSLEYYYDTDGQDGLFNNARVELEGYTSTLYAGGSGRDVIAVDDTTFTAGGTAWSYGRRHRQADAVSIFTQAQLRSFHQGWVYLSRNFDGTDRWATRGTPLGEAGPLMTQPGWTNLAFSFTSDWRKPWSVTLENHNDWGETLRGFAVNGSLRWNQGEHFSHSLSWNYRHNKSEAQHLDNFVTADSQTDVTGIGGVDFVFGELDQRIWDFTLRSNILFDRNHSLQLYVQPFLTKGGFSRPRYLAAADSYDLRPYDTDASLYDFRLSSVNLNLVYRWEYRPGSTFYLVWTHSHFRHEVRREAASPAGWRNDLRPGMLLDAEPHNTILAKLSYWFSI